MRSFELKAEVATAYAGLAESIMAMPDRFNGMGTLVYDGRNKIRRVQTDGLDLVVKRFKPLGLFKRFVYSFLRDGKAKRSYRNAVKLLERGFSTPSPVAYVECWRGGLLHEQYYICAHTEAKDIKRPLIECEDFDKSLATAYARFVAELHAKGVLHKDLNPTNVLYRQDGGEYRFELIDINRMKFYDEAVPKAECLENLTLFWWLTDVYRHVLREYINARGWTEADYQAAVSVKRRHDRRWVRRKKMTSVFKKHCK